MLSYSRVSLRSRVRALAAGRFFVLLCLGVLAAPAWALDLTPHGTQPGLQWGMEEPMSCESCHRGFSGTEPEHMPQNTWGGSMMANAARDPLFWAALDVANKDFPGAGDFCLRCHTPPGWLGGRVVKAIGGGDNGPTGALGCKLQGDYNNRDEKGNDYAGVTCHFCHRMKPTGPAGEPAMIGNGNIWLDDALECTPPNGGVPYGGPCRYGPYHYADNFLAPPHGWVQSEYHTKSAMCGTCHDVSTPDTDEGPLKTLVLEGGVATTRPMPIERTYSEWNRSLFADLIYRDGLGEGAAGTPALAREQHCQDCHMRTSHDPDAKACHQNLPGSRTGNLPMHEFAGANAWIPAIIRDEYGGKSGLERPADFDRTISLAREMLASAASVEANITAYTPPTASTAGSVSVRVKVTNLGGHKLPSGYSEGRRMWLNVKAVSASNAVLAESAAYDASSGDLTLDAQAKVYEVLQGIWTPGSPGECVVEVAGKKKFHFVLNNCIRKDNRIPPLGFRPKTAGDPNGDEVRPVAYSYPETSPGSGVLVNYDITDYTFPLPAAAARPIRIDARLQFQIASKDYIEFLRDQATTAPAIPAENTMCAGEPGRPFDIGPQSLSRGEYMYELWSNPAYGKSPPETAGNPASVTTGN